VLKNHLKNPKGKKARSVDVRGYCFYYSYFVFVFCFCTAFHAVPFFLRGLLVINTFRLRPAYVKTRKQDVSRTYTDGGYLGA